MNINMLLRRLTPGQILAAGVATLIVGLLALIFGILPLTATLLLPLGEPVAAVGSLLLAIVGGALVGNRTTAVFGQAYYDRKFDDHLYEAGLMYEKARHDG